MGAPAKHTPGRQPVWAHLAAIRRVGWGVADQALSSLTNVALGILVARSVDLAEFGAFSLAFAAYLLAVSVTRAYPMDPLAIRYAAAPATAFRRAASAATGTVVAVGIVCGIVLVLLGSLTSGALAASLVALGIMFPGLLLQDAWRSTFFAGRRGRSAFLNDLLWAAIQFPLLAAIIVSGSGTVFWLVAVWGGSATIAAVAGTIQASLIPRPWLALAWWREHIDLGPRFIAEAFVHAGSGQAVLYGVGLAAGLAAVGALRAGQLLFGPLQVVTFGVGMMALPEASHSLAVSMGRLRRVSFYISAGLALAAILWGGLVLLIPPGLGSQILRGAWEPARVLAVPIMLTSISAALSYGAGVGLRALGAAGRSLRATTIVASLTLVFGIGGSILDGAVGAAWGLCLAWAVGAAAFWYEYAGAAREYAPAGHQASGPGSDSAATTSSAELN